MLAISVFNARISSNPKQLLQYGWLDNQLHKLRMNCDENDSSEQQEGFFKPQLRVVESKQQSPPHPERPEEFASEANDLVLYNRPTDFTPRVLSISPPIYQQLIDLNLDVSHPKQQLFIIQRQRIKRCKYLSLADKYLHNELYKLVYCKLDNPNEFNSSIFSLHHTTDYNPRHYQHVAPNNGQAGKFDSRFESGNLNYAYQCMQSKMEEYDLILQNDTNTKGYNQWFYFSFRNESAKSVRFNIVNLIKKHSLFEEGVRPVGFSLQQSHRGWHSIGTQIDYQKSYISRQVSTSPPLYKNYYTLSFTVDFPSPNDVYYIALNYPYTYTRMIKFITEMPESNPSILVERSILAYTISNNCVPMVRLRHREYMPGGKKILVMGRQHPGETVGSFVLQAFVKQLIKDIKLLKIYQVILLPMLNPDGVIYGNFRTNLGGFDLNRQWVQPNKWLHPQVYYASKFIATLQNLCFVIDFHGHSKKYNSFIYACTGESPYLFRVFPYICGQQSELFSIKDCTYNITSDKERTARVKLYRQIKKPHVFTLETSFFGYTDQQGRKFRYQISDLYLMGERAAESLKLFLTKKKELMQYEKEVREKQYLFDQWSTQNKQDIDSESNPSEDQLTPIQRKERVLSERVKKKRKSKSKGKKKKPSKQDRIVQLQKQSNHEQKRQPSATQLLKLNEKPQVPKKKSESARVVHFNEVKINKKVPKSLAVISPPAPKSSAPNIIPVAVTKPVEPKQATSTFNLKHVEKVKQPEVPEAPVSIERKVREEPPTINPSNLFNTTNYYAQIHQKLKKEEKKSNLHQKTQSLQISNIKRQMIFPKDNTLNVLRRLISNGDNDQSKLNALDQTSNINKLLLRQNRIVSSKVHEDEMKRNLEQQINSRTEALKNCQKKMREMSLDEPILRSNQEILLLETTSRPFYINSTPKSYKFPAIRIDRKIDYFNF